VFKRRREGGKEDGEDIVLLVKKVGEVRLNVDGELAEGRMEGEDGGEERENDGGFKVFGDESEGLEGGECGRADPVRPAVGSRVVDAKLDAAES
jgi:hypothetical protein